MSVISGNIPLISLPAVLFPGTFLPLQLPEQKHRDLLNRCVDGNEYLGVVLNPGQAGPGRPAVPYTTGCLASVALMLADGEESNSVVLYGEQRMRVVDFEQQTDHFAGHVEMLKDYSGLHAQRRTKQAAQFFQRYLDLISTRYQTHAVNMPLPDDPIAASYLLASVLYLPLEVKQRWLESDSAALRLEEELAFLQAECEKLTTFLAISSTCSGIISSPISNCSPACSRRINAADPSQHSSFDASLFHCFMANFSIFRNAPRWPLHSKAFTGNGNTS